MFRVVMYGCHVATLRTTERATFIPSHLVLEYLQTNDNMNKYHAMYHRTPDLVLIQIPTHRFLLVSLVHVLSECHEFSMDLSLMYWYLVAYVVSA